LFTKTLRRRAEDFLLFSALCCSQLFNKTPQFSCQLKWFLRAKAATAFSAS